MCVSGASDEKEIRQEIHHWPQCQVQHILFDQVQEPLHHPHGSKNLSIKYFLVAVLVTSLVQSPCFSLVSPEIILYGLR